MFLPSAAVRDDDQLSGMYKLIIEDDEGKTTVVPLIRDEITIGRKDGNTIRLTERNVSRHHAKLLRVNGSIFIEDVSSSNGIRVNGDRIADRAELHDGDRVQIGDYLLALKLEAEVEQAPASGARTKRSEGESEPAARAGTAAHRAEHPADGPPPVPVSTLNDKTPQQLRISGVAPADSHQNDAVSADNSVSDAIEVPGRLVAVSANFAGQIFVLDHSPIVIGRTEDNDVVINHRSISRHHAQIVREDGHYQIVDLQSANGVRVNGEEYGKVELRRGDRIDLGHVRLRFVAPGEDFLFERDAEVVELGAARRPRVGVMLAFALVVLLGGGGLAWWRLSGSFHSSGSMPRPAADTETRVARLLLAADEAIKSEHWEEAIQRCDEALQLDLKQEVARDKRRRAEAERRNFADYQSFVRAAERDNLDAAVAAYARLTDDSIYRDKGAEQFTRVGRSYQRLHLEGARRAKAAGRCNEAAGQAQAVLSIDDGNSEAQEIVRTCESAATPPIQVATAAKTKDRAADGSGKPPLPGRRNTTQSESSLKVAGPEAEQPAPSAKPAVAEELPPAASRKTSRPPKPTRTRRTGSEAVVAAKPAEDFSPSDADDANGTATNAAIERILEDAQQAYIHGQYSAAIEQARRASQSQASKEQFVRAWRVIGASNCFLKDRSGALQAWNRLDQRGRQFLQYVCNRQQISVP